MCRHVAGQLGSHYLVLDRPPGVIVKTRKWEFNVAAVFQTHAVTTSNSHDISNVRYCTIGRRTLLAVVAPW
jgi:hypothetical protein